MSDLPTVDQADDDVLAAECVALMAPGPPREMRPTTIDVAPPGPGQVRLAVEACGLNPVDWKLAESGAGGWTWPHVLGLDIVGRVESVGPATQIVVGSRVAVHHDLTRQGGLARWATVDAHMCAVVPDDLASRVAATVPCPGLTAAQEVDRTRVQEGDRVLVIGAGGGVGGFATQLALSAGASVTAVAAAGDSTKLLGWGVDSVVDYREGPLTEIVAGPFDVVLDAVGADSRAATLLGYGGRLASVSRPEASEVSPFTTAPTLVEVALGAVYSHGTLADRERTGRRLGELLREVSRGRLQPPPMTIGRLAEAPALLQAMADGDQVGKVVIDLGHL